MTKKKRAVEHFEDITRYAAKTKGKMTLENTETNEVIELDSRLVSSVMCATLAYAATIIDGSCEPCDADEGYLSIIMFAADIYARDL